MSGQDFSRAANTQKTAGLQPLRETPPQLGYIYDDLENESVQRAIVEEGALMNNAPKG